VRSKKEIQAEIKKTEQQLNKAEKEKSYCQKWCLSHQNQAAA
jgi:hypothetical protein